jgi:hypothetical protein
MPNLSSRKVRVNYMKHGSLPTPNKIYKNKNKSNFLLRNMILKLLPTKTRKLPPSCSQLQMRSNPTKRRARV